MFILRAWVIPSTLLLAGLLALLTAMQEDSRTGLPTFRFTIPMPEIAVVLAGILLLRPLVDRHRAISLASPRRLWLLDLSRYAATAGAFTLVALVEFADRVVDPWSVYPVLGWSCAAGALAATFMPNIYWIPMTVLGYSWLRMANGPTDFSPPSLVGSLAVLIAGGIAYLAANAWVRSAVLSGRRPVGP
jgi:hypothetical protein